MNRNKTARQHNFAIVPGADVPRSKFAMRQTRKQAFDASDLIPIFCEEGIPGDTWQHTESVMARLATPIAPTVDDLDLETFYFWVPRRITDPNWKPFITGEDPDLVQPTVKPVNASGSQNEVVLGGVLDHFGLPQQVYSADVYFNRAPIDAYFKIYNEWFRDQNLQPEWEWPEATNQIHTRQYSDGTPWNQLPLRVNKRHDYFTSSLPWPQKGDAVSLSLGTTAPIEFITGGNSSIARNPTTGAELVPASGYNIQVIGDGTGELRTQTPTAVETAIDVSTNHQVDLTAASTVTINSLRLAVATQRMLERDARGGTRYIETILAHFGVRVPDYTAQRPEYLGGSKIPITVNPIAQTAAYDAPPTPEESPVGNLGAEMHASSHKKTFTFACTEHGYFIGLATVRSTPTYQQGTRRHWRRLTRLEFPWPELANIGEQAVDTQEIYQPSDNNPVLDTWGYQERNAEMRYTPNEITGVMRSTAPQPLDWWHYSEEFGSEPALNAAFITDKTKETLARSLATAPNTQWSAQIIMDIQHDSTVARLIPAYAVPGLKYL